MEIRRATLDTCSPVTGTAVVIDVIRAFTTAAFAFAAGAQDITLVGAVNDAFALRHRTPGALIMGKVNGLPVKGFDLGNSPSALIGLDLTGRRLIQRTSAGTQGVVLSTRADTILADSFCCAGATARYIVQFSPPALTFVITAISPDDEGDEDVACADYLKCCCWASGLMPARLSSASASRRRAAFLATPAIPSSPPQIGNAA